MPSNAQQRGSSEVTGSPESSGIPPEEDPPQREGAVGFQNPPSVPFLQNVIQAHQNLLMNQEANMSFEDSENNNVDENSNDHQFNQFADYHHQYHRQQHLLDNNPVYHTSRAAQERALRDRYYQRLPNYIDEPDRAPYTNNRENPPSIRSSNFVSHRRNYSEDLSLNANSLQPLPPRNSAIGAPGPPYHPGGRWLACLPRRQTPTSEEIKTGGEQLLYNFAIEQFNEQNVDPPQYFSVRPYNPAWSQAGRDLRLLADAFSKSPEREALRRKAYEVQMSSITFDNFFHLCSELFQGNEGITRERIVVLFTFISDVAIRHVRLKAERFIRQLMEWSLRFIFDSVCSWVQKAGGWNVVLSCGANLVYKFTMCTLAAITIVALGVYITKTIKDL